MVIPWQNGSQRLADEWKARLDDLEAEIRSRPDDRWLWLLQVRVRILIYLLSRHGDAVAPPPTAKESPADPEAGSARGVRNTIDRDAYLIAVRPRIRRHLESLEESNTRRYLGLPDGAPQPIITANVNASSIVELMFFIMLASLALPGLVALLILLVWIAATA